MLLKISDVMNMLTAHRALDGWDTVVTENGTQRVVRQHYPLAFTTRMDVAENIESLMKLATRYEAERVKAFTSVAGTSQTLEPGSAEAVKFAQLMDSALQQDHEVKLNLLDIEELAKLEQCPPSVLAVLLPLKKKGAAVPLKKKGDAA